MVTFSSTQNFTSKGIPNVRNLPRSTLSVCMASRELLSKRISADASGTVSAFATFLFALPFYLVLWTALLFCGVESARVESGFWFWIVCRALSDVGAEWSKMVAISYGELSLVSCVLVCLMLVI